MKWYASLFLRERLTSIDLYRIKDKNAAGVPGRAGASLPRGSENTWGAARRFPGPQPEELDLILCHEKRSCVDRVPG